MILNFMPSEVARLILGYLKEIRCLKTVGIFLAECNDLREYVDCLQMGREYPTSIGGKNLIEILEEYCTMTAAENSKLPIDGKQLINKLEGLLTQIKYLLIQSNNCNSHNIQVSTIDRHARKQQSNTRLSLAASRKETANTSPRSNCSTSSEINHLDIQEVDISENPKTFLSADPKEVRLPSENITESSSLTSNSVVPVSGIVEDLILNHTNNVISLDAETLRNSNLSSQVSLDAETLRNSNLSSQPIASASVIDKNVSDTNNAVTLSLGNSTNSEQFHCDQDPNRQSNNLPESVLHLQPQPSTFIEVSTPTKERISFEDGQFRSPRRKCHPPKKRSGVVVQTAKRTTHDEETAEDQSEESLDLSVFLEQLITNTALHEKIAENINKVVGCNNLEPMEIETENISSASDHLKEQQQILPCENVSSLCQISTKELYMPESLIKDILNRTESDPVFEEFIHGFFDKIEVCSTSNDGCNSETNQLKSYGLPSSESANEVGPKSPAVNITVHPDIQIHNKENSVKTTSNLGESATREARNEATCSVLPSPILSDGNLISCMPTNSEHDYPDPSGISVHDLDLCNRTSVHLIDSQSMPDNSINKEQHLTSFHGISSSISEITKEVPSNSVTSVNSNEVLVEGRSIEKEQQESCVNPGRNNENKEMMSENHETATLNIIQTTNNLVENVIAGEEAAFVIPDKDVSVSNDTCEQVTESNNQISNLQIEKSAALHLVSDTVEVVSTKENVGLDSVVGNQEFNSDQPQNKETDENSQTNQSKLPVVSLETNSVIPEKILSHDLNCIAQPDPNMNNQIISLALNDPLISELQQNNVCHIEYTDQEGRIIRIQALGAWYNELPSSLHQIVEQVDENDPSQQVHVTVTPIELLPMNSSTPSSQEHIYLPPFKEANVNNEQQSLQVNNSTNYQYLTLSPNHLYSSESTITMALAANQHVLTESNRNQVNVLKNAEIFGRLKKLNSRRGKTTMKIKSGKTKVTTNSLTTKANFSRLQRHVVRVLDMGGPTDSSISEQNKDSGNKTKLATNSTSNKVPAKENSEKEIPLPEGRDSTEKNQKSSEQNNGVVSDPVICSTKENLAETNSNNSGKKESSKEKPTRIKRKRSKSDPKTKKTVIQKKSKNSEPKNSKNVSTESHKKDKTVKNCEKPKTVKNCEKPKSVKNCEKPKTVKNCEKPKTVKNCEKPKTVKNCEKPKTKPKNQTKPKSKKSKKVGTVSENVGPLNNSQNNTTSTTNIENKKKKFRANILSRKNKLLQSPQLKNLITSARSLAQLPQNQESHVRILNFDSPAKQPRTVTKNIQKKSDVEKSESVIYYSSNSPLSTTCSFLNLYQLSKRMRKDSSPRDRSSSSSKGISNINVIVSNKRPSHSKSLTMANSLAEKNVSTDHQVEELTNGSPIQNQGSRQGSPCHNEVAATLVSLGEQIPQNTGSPLPVNLSKGSPNNTVATSNKRKREEEEHVADQPQKENTGEAHTLLVGMDVDKFLSRLHYVE